jgi:hypothetical protein
MTFLDLVSRATRKLGLIPQNHSRGPVWETQKVRLLGPKNTVISEPGIYSLEADLEGEISIAASNVVMHMHGRAITGGTEKDTKTCGISVASGTSDITISGGTVRGHHYGLRADKLARLLIDRMTFGQQTFRGIRATAQKSRSRTAVFSMWEGQTSTATHTPWPSR